MSAVTEAAETVTYLVARGFKHGLRCHDCHRVIPDGGPYARRLDHLTEDGTPASWIVCVYCAMEHADGP